MKMEKYKNKTFYVQISPAVLKMVVKILGGLLTDTVKLCITPKGITLIAFDTTMVAMMEVKLDKPAFEKYEATEFELGLDLERIKKIVALAKTNDIITIKFDCKKNLLIIDLDNLRTRMGIVDLKEMPDARTSILNSSGHIVIEVDELKRGITAAKDVSDSVLLSVDREKFELNAEKNTDSVLLSLPKRYLIEHESEVYHKNSFSSNHLSNVIRCLNGEYPIRLRFGSKTPLQLDYVFSEGNAKMTYVLLSQVGFD